MEYTYVCMIYVLCMYIQYVLCSVYIYGRMYVRRVCVYVSMYVCMCVYVCMYMCVCVNVYIRMYVCMYMYVCTRVCMYVCVNYPCNTWKY
jgi:hypothetical protein